MLPNTVSFLSGGRFFLVEQPNVRQRKSYKNENRYILFILFKSFTILLLNVVNC